MYTDVRQIFEDIGIDSHVIDQRAIYEAQLLVKISNRKIQ